MTENSILTTIHSPGDLKQIPENQLPRLAKEIRSRIINVISRNGGHLASNLGVVELTIALHRVFNSPTDNIIWDVGHQCYTHKLLTGRNVSFDSIRQTGGISGFPKPGESKHDIAVAGHASTSISHGLGLLAGKKIRGTEGHVIAVIGDGAMTGGLSFEALNHAGNLKKNLIVIYNDNKMSICPNVGAFSQKSITARVSSIISRLTATRMYQRIRDAIDRGIKVIPFIGMIAFDWVMLFKRGMKAVLLNDNFFTDLGFEYIGPIDGHCISSLTRVITRVKGMQRPVVVHVVTKKGKGYKHAEGDPTSFHGTPPFSISDGTSASSGGESYTEVFSRLLFSAAKTDSSIAAVTAAMAKGTGLMEFREQFPERFFDVGIAEGHAVTFASGLANAGMKPVVAVYSTFLQRSVDQVIHDVALPDLPVLIAADRSGLVASDGETHQGLFDIGIFRTVPNMTIVAPSNMESFRALFNYCMALNSPSFIRYPKAVCPSGYSGYSSLVPGRGVFVRKGDSDSLIINVGGLLDSVMDAADITMDELSPDILDLLFIKPLDEQYLIEILMEYEQVLLLEDGMQIGGIGEHIGALISQNNLSLTYDHWGVKDRFYPQADRQTLLNWNQLDKESISGWIKTHAGSVLNYLPKIPR